MPKSRQRKNHKQKVQARNQRNLGLQNEEMQKYLEKLSGMTETQLSGEVSGPVQ